jgi:uncharacterized iron-regulated protein
MEICKNKRSDQYFIYIEKTGGDEALLVTPEAQVKSLKLNLFNEVEEREEDYLIQNEMLTEAQVQRFHEYRKNRSDEIVERFEYYIETLSTYEKEELLKKLQEMV